MSKIMAVNAGSSSLKFQLLQMPEEEVLVEGIIERIKVDEQGDKPNITIKYNGEKFQDSVKFENHEKAINYMLEKIIELNIISSFDEIQGVGHRVVAGGEWFNKSTEITEDALDKIEKLKRYAPLHNPANAEGIRAFQKITPKATQVAVFDTAFHQTMPEDNYLYPLPYEYYTRYGARKYGAHGTSHQYVSQRAAEMLGKPLNELKAITLHLGAGASATAIKDGKSYDTSMGFTPVAGLVMATRVGDVDPSLVNYLREETGLTNDEMLDILNNKSGLLGISSISADMRDLEEVMDTNHHAALAIKMMEGRIIRYIGQYLAELEGADAIVFTAGIGENAPETRAHVLNAFNWLGVEVDDQANNVRGEERIITTPNSKIAGLLIPTNEELMIARDVVEIIEAK